MAFTFLKIFIFVMFFQPVYTFPSLEPFRPYKYSAILAAATFIFFGKFDFHSFFSNKTNRYFILFSVCQVISASSIWLTGGLNLFKDYWLNLLIVYVPTSQLCIDHRKIRSIILIIVISIFYLSYESVSTVIFSDIEGLRPKGFGWYDYPNDLVLILTCAIPFALCLGETSRNLCAKSFWYFITATFSYNILLSASRNGLLGLITVGFLSFTTMRNISNILKSVLNGLLIFGVLTVGLTAVMNRSDLVPGQLTGDDSSEHRIVQWKACYAMVKDHPLLGVGPGESVYHMRDYGGIGGLVPHNTLIQVFAETGIPGGFFFFMFALYPIYEAYKHYKAGKFNTSDPIAIYYRYLIISLIGFWSCAFFTNRIYFHILYVTIALLTATMAKANFVNIAPKE